MSTYEKTGGHASGDPVTEFPQVPAGPGLGVVVERATTPTGGHVLRVKAARYTVDLEIECHEPAGAPCRLTCAVCDSEEPLPHIEVDDADVPTGGTHATRDMGECNTLLWLSVDPDLLPELHDPAAEGEPLNDGMQVDILWYGDAVYWRGASPKVPCQVDFQVGAA